METRKLVKKQIELQNKVVRLANVNIVTCGSCGTVLLHERNDQPIECYHCGAVLEQCDCPDLWYNGMDYYETI
jgi:hypothetical protein